MNKLLILLLATGLFDSGYHMVYAQTPQFETNRYAQNNKRKKRRSKKRHRSKSTRTDTQSFPSFGAGLNLGSEASFGNGLSLHLQANRYFEIELGLGFNTSGLKAGLASNIYIPVHEKINLIFAPLVAYSGGQSSDTVELDGIQFFPEGSSQSETITATKAYSVESAIFIGGRIGGSFALTKNLHIRVVGNYNHIVSGNEVAFEDGITFTPNVEVTNRDQFNAEFQEKAAETVAAGGLGFSLGVIYYINK